MLLVVMATGEAERAQGIGRLYGKRAKCFALGQARQLMCGI
jgi:hypothetical protein